MHETKAICSAALLTALLCSCGPRHEGGDGSGEAGDANSGGSAVGGSGGVSVGGSSAVGGSGGSAIGGSSGSSSSGGRPTSPASEPVIGCAAAHWPDAGWFFEAPPLDEFSDRPTILLARFTAGGISGDGKLVVGSSPDLPYSRGLPIAWSAAGGVVELPHPPYESYAQQASCDGSVVLEQDLPFQQIYRVEGAQEPEVVLYGTPPAAFVHTNPDASVIVNGYGLHGEFDSTPLRWTRQTGMTTLDALLNDFVYHVSPDGTLLAADADELFEYDVATDARTPVGMSPIELGSFGPASLHGSADGTAWVQSADLNYDSFLVWRAPAEPRSVTCPTSCRVVDVSGTGQVALLDVALASDDPRVSSW
ncbi:MAG TPA: hypothetical protein VEQ58_06315, partial [Polyangiaceae bacterium]|nr:hypothetical protein [Polyangiaceae bacterium]